MTIFQRAFAGTVLLAASAAAVPAVAVPITSNVLGDAAFSVNPLPFGLVLSGSMSGGGLTFSGGANYPSDAFDPDQSYLDWFGPITLSFDAPIDGFGFGFTDDGSDVIVSAYDANDTLLETATFSTAGLPTQYDFPTGYAGMVDLAGASRAVITTTAGLKSIYIGTVSFTAAPEPASWALMLAGFGAIGGTLRRRRVAFA